MNDQRIDNLQSAIDRGIATGEFPTSLVAQFERKGSLSDKQWYWVERLAQPRPAPTEDLGSFVGVIELFERAKRNLKFPKIWLSFNGGRPLRLSLAGERSKHTGSVQITDGGGYHDGIWYGRVAPDGSATFSRSVEDTDRNALINVLRHLAEHPAEVASQYGKLTGNCCFCHRELSDERSTEVGYGPICAQNYGLPWGTKDEPAPLQQRGSWEGGEE